MIIKKFQGKTEEEAIAIAKKELGESVVVMNIKTVKPEGFFAFLKPQLIEATVALEEEQEKPIRSKKEEGLRNINTLLGTKSDMDQNKFSIFTPEIIEKSEAEILGKKNKEDTEKVLEEKLDSLQSLIEKQLKQPNEQKGEIKIQEERPKETVEFFKILYNMLIENEVNEKYVNQLISEVDKVATKNSSMDLMIANIYQKIILKFGQPEGIIPAVNKPKVILFIGPTGVGKTTTIAKIASKFSVNENKKIALLTADTYRIAAAEQLRTYANILDVAFRVIYTKEEMQTAVNDFSDYDYILVDTAGHSHKNPEQNEGTKEFLACLNKELEKEVFLVLSATTKYKDLISIADSYLNFTDFKLIFTKLDETTTLGNILNLKLHTNAPISYVTCGQNVPDDIANFNPQFIVKQLLSGKK